MDENELETVEDQPKSLSLLASERFPNSYVGEVNEEVIEETSQDDPETDPEEVVSQEEEVVEEEVEEVSTNTLEDVQAWLAQEQNLDIDFDEITVPLKVNGKTVNRTIADLRANSQKLEAADDILTTAKVKAKEDREAYQSELESKNQQVTESLTVTAMLVQSAEKLLSDEREAIDWDGLRTTDKAEWVAKREEFKEKQNVIDRIKYDAASHFQNLQAQSNQEMEVARQEHLIQEQQRLLDRLPEWADETTATKEKEQISGLLVDLGFSNEEIAQAGDHRLILLAREAMLYRNQSERVDVTRKKLASIPKVIKPGSPKTSDQRNSEAVKAAKSKMTERPTVDNAFRLLKAKRGK